MIESLFFSKIYLIMMLMMKRLMFRLNNILFLSHVLLPAVATYSLNNIVILLKKWCYNNEINFQHQLLRL